MIELKHITKLYGNFKALDDINLSIKDGEIFGIVGQSGAGKSTLIRCVNMLEPPTSGEVIIDGKDMTKLSKAQLREERKKIGMIFQHFNLLSNRTVAGNVAFPLELSHVPKAEQAKRINEILELVGLTEYRNKYPSQLSGGQKQRVGIARAIVSNPSVLLSDEATSALDPETVKSILQLLKDINKKMGITIIMITHQMEVIKEIAEQVVRAVVLHGQQQAFVGIVGKYVDVQDVGRVAVGDAGIHFGVDVVPGDDIQIQLDAGVLGLELIDEVRAVHALAQEPLVGVGAILADDDVQGDLVIGESRGSRQGEHHDQSQQKCQGLFHNAVSPFHFFVPPL